MLTKEAVEEYKALYFKVYGVTLSDSEAEARAAALIKLYMIVYGNSNPVVSNKE